MVAAYSVDNLYGQLTGGIYDYLDESTRFCREKCKTKNINKP